MFIYFYQLKNEVKCRLRRIEKLTHHLGHHRAAVFQIILHHPLYQLDQEGFIVLHKMREFHLIVFDIENQKKTIHKRWKVVRQKR